MSLLKILNADWSVQKECPRHLPSTHRCIRQRVLDQVLMDSMTSFSKGLLDPIQMSKILVSQNLEICRKCRFIENIVLSKLPFRRKLRFAEILIRSKIEINMHSSEDYDILVLGSGDGMEDEMVDEGPVKGPFLVIIIVGSVLLFILLCLVVPCIIECRKCRREGKKSVITGWNF